MRGCLCRFVVLGERGQGQGQGKEPCALQVRSLGCMGTATEGRALCKVHFSQEKGGEGFLHERILVLSPTEHGVGISLCNTIRRITRLTRQWLVMAQTRGQVVKVVIEPIMPARVRCIHSRNRIQLGIQRLGVVQVQRPVCRGAAHAVARVQGTGGAAGIRGFERVDRVGLDGHIDGLIGERRILSLDDLADDL